MDAFVYVTQGGEILLHTKGDLSAIGGWGTLVGKLPIPVCDIETGEELPRDTPWPGVVATPEDIIKGA